MHVEREEKKAQNEYPKIKYTVFTQIKVDDKRHKVNVHGKY